MRLRHKWSKKSKTVAKLETSPGHPIESNMAELEEITIREQRHKLAKVSIPTEVPIQLDAKSNRGIRNANANSTF